MAEADSICSCVHCGGTITPRVNKTGAPSKAVRRYCSSRCQWSWHDGRRPGRIRQPIRPVACHGCGVVSARPLRSDEAGRYCSRKCNTDAMARVAAGRAALLRIKKAWAWRPSPLVVAECAALKRIAGYVERPVKYLVGCRQCDARMVWTRKTGGCQRFCDACKKAKGIASRHTEGSKRARRVAKAKRRAVERGAMADNIDPIKVFERDGWRCHLCKRLTHKARRGTAHPRAPELDHVVTLADGGAHTWGNVACSCRECNAVKGGKSMGQIGLPIAA